MGIQERKEREKEQRRNDIIDAAEEVFFEKGLIQSTMDDVAEMAELSKGTLYLYFKSKDELRFAIMERAVEIMGAMMQKAMLPERTGKENLMEMGRTLVRFSNENPEYFKVMVSFQAEDSLEQNIDEELIKEFVEKKSSLEQIFETLHKGIKDGSIRSDIEVIPTGMTLWAEMMGLLIMFNHKKFAFENHGVSRDKVVETHLELITNGLKPGNK